MSRRVDYLNYIANGGNVNDLPLPMAPEDYPLYKIATGGVGGTGVLKNSGGRVNGYYSCLLNSDSGSYNFCSTILDLGETKRVTSAKVRAKFIVKNGAQAELPIKLGFRLFANNSAGRDFIAGYNKAYDGLVSEASQVAGNKEFVLEAEFTSEGGQTDNQPNLLNTCRYLKPFIILTKQSNTDNNRTLKHHIHLYEVTIEIDGLIYDITDTVADFAPYPGSKITYVDTILSKQALMIRNGKWHGKTVACMGDSITFGMKSGGNNQTAKEDNPWASQLRDYCGFTNIRNYGISGSTVAQYYDKNPMHSRITNMDANADVVIFMGGTNDVSNGTPIGTLQTDDSQTLNTSTFYGALQTCVKALKQRFPNKPIVLMTPINADNVNIPKNVSARTNLHMDEYRNAIKEVAKFYGVYLFDLQNALPFDALNDTDNVYFAANDKIHPNQNGHDGMAKVIGQYINSLA